MSSNKRILFIGPHPDDVELGCGGFIAKNKTASLYYAVMCPCLEIPENKNILEELKNSIETLGIPESNLTLGNLPLRLLHDHRSEVREELLKLKKTVKPHIVFCPSILDVHQDHEVLAVETFRLFRDVSIFNYEVGRSILHLKPNLYVHLTEEQLETKVKALMCYKSQQRRFYFKPEVFRSLATIRGVQCGAQYAEAFEVLRLHL